MTHFTPKFTTRLRQDFGGQVTNRMTAAVKRGGGRIFGGGSFVQ